MITPLTFADAVARLVQTATDQSVPSSRTMIALAGLPGSGKTTLATQLAEAVNTRTNAKTMVALSMDGFHFPKSTLSEWPNATEAFIKRGAEWTFDVGALKHRLLALRQNRDMVEWPDFDHTIGDPIEGAHQVPLSASLVLVEGLYLLGKSNGWQDVSAVFDERWYLDTPYDVALTRLKNRHMNAWGITEQAALERIATNDEHNARVVQETRAHAEWLVSSS